MVLLTIALIGLLYLISRELNKLLFIFQRNYDIWFRIPSQEQSSVFFQSKYKNRNLFSVSELEMYIFSSRSKLHEFELYSYATTAFEVDHDIRAKIISSTVWQLNLYIFCKNCGGQRREQFRRHNDSLTMLGQWLCYFLRLISIPRSVNHWEKHKNRLFIILYVYLTVLSLFALK